MQARITHNGEVTVVSIIGRVDLEAIHNFRKICMEEWVGKKIIFNLAHMNFVGSNGIMHFLRTLNELRTKNNCDQFKLVAVPIELKKLISHTPLANMEFFEDQQWAIASFNIMPRIE